MTSFPEGFVWGAATAAHQIEGNNVGSDWWRLEHRVPAITAEPSGDACDSWHRWEEDLDLVADSGLTSYRFSIEWARLEPAPGEFSRAALAHYQAMIDGCRSRGLEPVVTLHHFTNPAWLREQGGWTSPGTVELFARYASRVLPALSGLGRVCTMNEPNLIATFAGALGNGPVQSEPGADPDVIAILLEAHQRAMEVIQSIGATGGLTLAMTAYTTDGSDEATRIVNDHRALDEDPFLLAPADFLGVQAYTRRFVTADRMLPHGDDFQGTAAHRTLTGWNYYPQSVGDCLRYAHQVAPSQALLVTENGIATSDDAERIAYASGALESVLEAIGAGVDVRGYWHWSLLDNFEWTSGYGPTFGLVAVDRETFVRTPKPSLGWLGQVAKDNALA